MTRVTINPTSRKPQKGLVHAHEVIALHPRIESLFSGVRMPTYKANDSDDLHLMELISPSHELHRKLMEGRRPMTTQHQHQHTPMSLHPSSIKSLDSTPRTKYKQAALKTLQTFPLSNKLSARLFGGYDPGPPLSSSRESIYDRKKRKQSKKPNRDTLGFEDIRDWNNSKPSKNYSIKPTMTDQPHQNNTQPMAENIHQNILPFSDICNSKPSKKHTKPTMAEQTQHNNTPPMPENMHQNTLPYSDIRILNPKPSNKQAAITLAEQIHQNIPVERHQNTRGLEPVRIPNSEPSTHREFNADHEDTVVSRRRILSLGPSEEDQRASDLRLISRLWHQECKSAIPIQQRLAHLLNTKYKEAFEDGWMVSCEKCKHNDFKAEVAQVLKNLERAGAPQMATLNLKYELAVACVDEVMGKGMGEEYVKLEGWFLRPSSGVRVLSRDPGVLKEVAGRVQAECVELRNITGFMLDQLLSS